MTQKPFQPQGNDGLYLSWIYPRPVWSEGEEPDRMELEKEGFIDGVGKLHQGFRGVRTAIRYKEYKDEWYWTHGTQEELDRHHKGIERRRAYRLSQPDKPFEEVLQFEDTESKILYEYVQTLKPL